MSKSIIYSVLLHLILALYLIFVFNLSKRQYDQNEKLHVKIEVKDLGLLSFAQEDQSHDSLIKKPEENQINKEEKPKEQKPEEVKSKPKDNNKKTKVEEIKKSLLKAPLPAAVRQSKKKIAKKEKSDLQNKVDNSKKDKNIQKTLSKIDSIVADNNQSQPVQETPKQQEQKAELIKKENLKKKIEEKEFQLAQKSISGLNLSNREKFNLYSQIKSCFQRAIAKSEVKSKEKILVKINIDQNGYIKSDINELEEMIKYKEQNQEDFAASVENAKMALEMCNPLRGLPLEKYEIWQEIILEFSQAAIDGQT